MSKPSLLQHLIALAALLVSVSSDCPAEPEGTSSAVVTLRANRFAVEVANDDASRMRGLMFRQTLAQDSGMLFVFEQEQPLAFWMKNTLIPLDILYFDRARKLVSAQLDTPPCKVVYCPAYPSARPAQFVLELNAGTAKRIGLEVGDEIEFVSPAGAEAE